MLRNKLKLLLIPLLTGLLACEQAFARLYDDVMASGYIRIGVYKDFPPYSFVKDGNPSGVDVEIARRIAEAFDLDLQLHWITPDENLEDDLRNNVWKGHYLDKDEENPLAMKHLADVMLRVPYDKAYAYKQDSLGYLINEQVVMKAPYQQESWQVAYDSNRLNAVRTVAVFQYEPIGVEVDSVPAFYFTSAMGGRMRNMTRHYPTPGLAFEAMQKGEVAAVMAMQSEIDWLLKQAGDPQYRLAENGFPTMGKQTWDIGIAIRQSDRQLGYAVEEVLDGMIRSGDMAELFASYGLRYTKPEFYQVMAEVGSEN
ncbi:substrate-binding periplasmic protein [Marinobacterium sediminicola]|uniref:Amino acid ABC transporter substrate-binding protein, PAAT family n=1 Tax=Marinobacterium sediminicola TaxID=518898 RepID=A0ABY1RXW3_9GAMM|nr:transporter substrate-binding domain-containing protein [Marinobacterium sediminicola]ULG67742.1 transporter substrate-binding domain-containing protein [Marinobacterium sediminicola]SMR71614.1 amino acid ABC transporter substrate-binding protein, PAAT family [Marinobacterium sediminicola]